MSLCTTCGKQNLDTTKFCTGCGIAIGKLQSIEKKTTPTGYSFSKSKVKPVALVIIAFIALAAVSSLMFFNTKKQPITKEQQRELFADTLQQKQNLLADSGKREEQLVIKTLEPEKEAIKTNGSVKWTTEHSLVSGTYTGTIGNKKFILKFEFVWGNNVKGYNIAGNNKRPFEGMFTESHGSFDNDGDGTKEVVTNIYDLKLKEPGTDEWDGEFSLRIELCDWFGEGSGTWKSYNGKLNRIIKIKDLEIDKILSGE